MKQSHYKIINIHILIQPNAATKPGSTVVKDTTREGFHVNININTDINTSTYAYIRTCVGTPKLTHFSIDMHDAHA